MVRINLLPPKMRQTVVLTKSNIAVIALAEIIFLMICLYSYSCWRLANLTEQLQASRQKLMLLQPAEARRLHLVTDQRCLLDKVKIVSNLADDEYNLYGILLSLGKDTPEKICLTKVAMLPERQILVHGYALGYEELGKFTTRLAETGLLGQIELQSCETVRNNQEWKGYLNFVIKSISKG